MSELVASGDVAGLSPFGLRRSIRRVVAGSDAHKWVQQCLTFELIENIGTASSPGFGRCLRISTAGTLIDAAAYRGRDQEIPEDPYSRSLADQLGWMSRAGGDDRIDNLLVLDDVHLTIEATSPSEDKANPGRDWTLIDASPTTKNKQSLINTSTTLGFNAGVFADTPTAGMDFSTTTSHEWSLPDYAVGATGGLGSDGEPRITWRVKRSDPDSDPLIAKSSLQPHFEAVFGLRPDAFPKRYSSITTMMTLTFAKITADDEAKYLKKLQGATNTPKDAAITAGDALSLALSTLNASTLLLSAPTAVEVAQKAVKIIGTTEEEEFKSTVLNRHSFMMTFVVDWDNGTVSAFMPIQSKTSGPAVARLYTVQDLSGDFSNTNEEIERLKNGDTSSLMEATTAPILFEPEIPQEANFTELRLEFRDGSAAGVASRDGAPHADASTSTYDVRFPVDALRGYSDRFSIYSGYPRPEPVRNPQWLPFKRAARITGIKDATLIWAAPTGYSRDSVWELYPSGSAAASPRQFTAMDRIGLPEVPDSYWRSSYEDDSAKDKSTSPNQNKDELTSQNKKMRSREYLAWRDRIFIGDHSGWTEFRSCFGGLTSAIFGENLSLGIAQGRFVASDNHFDTPSGNVESVFKSSGKSLIGTLNDLIYGCFNVWMFRLDVEAVVVADEQIAFFEFPDFASGKRDTPISVEICHWREWSEKSGARVPKTDETGRKSRRDAVGEILARDGIRKPITGWAGTVPHADPWLKPTRPGEQTRIDGQELLFQKLG